MIEFLSGTALIVAIFLLGNLLHRFVAPIPEGVLGLLLFYVGLQVGIVKLRWVERASSFLLRHMVLLFIPLTVGLMDLGKVLARQWWIICGSLLLSFLAVLLVTGLLGERLLASGRNQPDTENAQ